MSNIINLNNEREKRTKNVDFFSNIVEQSSMDTITLELIRNIIGLLQDYDIDPQAPETAENMIFLSMLFQAHIDNMNGKENIWINLFDDMRKMVQESE
jgi:hypothetical protein